MLPLLDFGIKGFIRRWRKPLDLSMAAIYSHEEKIQGYDSAEEGHVLNLLMDSNFLQ